MGKKAKVGKQRKDKFYFLAKEAGYRSRAAFKLLQLNKRFEFLQQSRALVDLCAAPGGWLQVAEQNMPVSSIRIGVDLVPIKPIKGCVTIQGDITEEKTRHSVRKELNKWEADCVLNDGAPNIGTNWAHDAFQQNCLTLTALRLATLVLRRGGYFVTKVFRSADSQTLISGVFEKLFKKVHVWKPAASRQESAEIFVVCERFLKPDKVDPELLDPKKVFSESKADDNNEKINFHRLLLHPGRKEKKAKAIGYEEEDGLSQFKELPVSEFLASKNALQLLGRASTLVLDSEMATNSEQTTEEIRECLKDIKVCGPAEMRKILAWRKKLVTEQKKEKKTAKNVEEDKNAKEDEEDENGDGRLMEVEEEQENAEMKELEEIDELIRNAQAEEKTGLKKRKKKLLKEKRKLAERKKLNMVHEGDVPTIGEDLELFSLRTLRKMAEKAKAMSAAKAVRKEEEEDVKMEEMEEEGNDGEEEEKDDGEEGTVMKGEIGKEEDGDDRLDDLDEDEEENTGKSRSGKRKLSPEQLAMGEQMIYSKKRARELEDWAWNRHSSNDDGLPVWFVEDERKHCTTEPPVDRDRVNFYINKNRSLNTRTIKKVVEAKMRKKQRRFRRLEKVKKKAEGIMGNEQMEHGEKVKELKRMYKKAGAPEKKKVNYQVVTKGKRGGMTRPKGPYKLVDRRLRKDTRGGAAGRTRGKEGPAASRARGKGRTGTKTSAGRGGGWKGKRKTGKSAGGTQ